MNQSSLFVFLILTCTIYTVASAPNPTFGGAVVGLGISPVGFGYSGGYGGYGYGGYPGYGYGGYGGGCGGGYGRRYRYPHFYPPIAVLAG